MRRWTFYIDEDGVVRHVDRQVDVGRHGENVVERVRKLGWDRPGKRE
jgi:peroxiredoxin